MEMETGFWGNVHLLFPARLDRRRKSEGNCLTLPYLLIPFALPQMYSYLILFVNRFGGWLFFLATAVELLLFNENFY
jgi:hypothetical protein